MFIDLDEVGPGRTPDSESDFARQLLTAAGAKIFNAFTDGGNVFPRDLKARFGPTAWEDEVTDGTDVVCFFPSLTSEICEAVFRKELATVTPSENSFQYQICQRLNMLRCSRPYSGEGKPLVDGGLRLDWEKRKKQ